MLERWNGPARPLACKTEGNCDTAFTRRQPRPVDTSTDDGKRFTCNLRRRRRNSDCQGHLRLERAFDEKFCAQLREHECGDGLDRSTVHVRFEPPLGTDVWPRARAAGNRWRSDAKPEKRI